MRRTLRNRLLASYLILIALFGGGVVLTLFSVRELGQRTELLVDRYWQDNNLIAKLYSLLSEVALFVNRLPESETTIADQQRLKGEIDVLVVQLADSTFREDFRNQQVAQLTQLKNSLADPVAVLSQLELQNRMADANLQILIAEAVRRDRQDIARDLTIAALAYRDYYVTANPSDLEIFRQQLERLGRHHLSADFTETLAAFRESGEAVFTKRQELRSSREQIVAQIQTLSESLRERTELYAQRVIHPARQEIQSDLAVIPGILLAAVIVSGLAALGAAYLLARHISVPLEQATGALRRIEQGDLAARVETAGDDDLEILGRTINSLAVSLQQTLSDLNSTVQRLSESEESYRQIAGQRLDLERIINASPTLAFLCRIEAGYPVLFVSAGLSQYGYQPDDLLQQRIGVLELIHRDDRAQVEKQIARHVDDPQGRELFLEFRLRKGDGEIRRVDARLLVQRDARGTATHLQGVLLDITENMRLREQADQASRLASLGELAAGVAHEINNPNAMILLNAAVLKEIGEATLERLDQFRQEHGDFALGRMPYSRLRSEIPRLHTEILDAAGRIRRIVEDLKEFVGAPPPEFRQSVDLNAVAQAAARLTVSTLKKATDCFTTAYAADLPTFEGHPQRLEQVVVNLLMNACQALPGRQAGITMSTGRLDEEKSLYLEVRDDGRGIDPADLPHVTDPFFTTRREDGGTGLGLSVSARIVREHGGRLDIDSTPGRGTSVRAIIPLSAAEPG